MSKNTTDDPSFEDVAKFDKNQLVTYLQSYLQGKNLTLEVSEIQKLREEDINGHVFLSLTDELLTSLNLSLGKRLLLSNLIKKLNSQSKFYHNIV